MTEKTPTGIYFETKKKPFDIQIDNNKKEPKLSKNVRYTDKQNYRRYKTLTEPKLLSRIMVDDDSANVDIQDKIQKLLGFKVPPKKDERFGENEDVFTAPSAYIEPPNPRAVRIEPRAEASPTVREPTADVRAVAPEEDYSGIASSIFGGILEYGDLSDITVDDIEKLTGDVVSEDNYFDIYNARINKEMKEREKAMETFKAFGERRKVQNEMKEWIEKLKKYEEPMMRIQSAARGKLVRDQYKEIIDATTNLQAAMRGNKAREEYKLK